MADVLQRADALLSVGRYPQAAELLSQHLASAPDDAAALTTLASVRLHLEDVSGSLEAAGRAAALAPDSAAPHQTRSYAFYLTGDLTSAVAAAREAVRLAPQEWASHALLAGMLCEPYVNRPRGGRGPELDEASAAADRAAELAPDQAGAHAAQGRVALARGDLAGAEAGYGRALAIDPHSSRAQTDLALVRERAGSLRSSARRYVAAAAADPHDPTAAYNVLGLAWKIWGLLCAALFVLATTATIVGGVAVDVLVPAGFVLATAVTAGIAYRLPRQVRLVFRRALRRGWGPVSAAAVTAAMLLTALAPWQQSQSSARVLTGMAAFLCGIAYAAVVVAVSRAARDFDMHYGAGAVKR